MFVYQGVRPRASRVLLFLYCLVLLSCGGGDGARAPTTTVLGYVPNVLDNSVTGFALNASTGLLAQQATAITGLFPVYVAITPDHRFLYVSNARGGTISTFALDGKGGMQLSGSDTPVASATAQPFQMVIASAGDFLYVGTTNSIEIFRIDSQSGQLNPISMSPIAMPSATTQLELTRSGDFLFAVGDNSDVIYRFSVSKTSGELTPLPGGAFHTGVTPTHIRVHSSDKYLFITTAFYSSQPSQQLFVYRILTNGDLQQATAPAPTGYGGFPFNVSPDGRFVYVCAVYDNELVGYKFDEFDGSLRPIAGSPFHEGQNASSLVFSPDSKFLVVSRINPGSLATYKVDQSSGAISFIPRSETSTGWNPVNPILVRD